MDMKYEVANLDQRAKGTLTIDSFDDMTLQKATLGITVTDYEKTIAGSAVGYINILEWSRLVNTGFSVTVGTNVLVEGVDWNAATSNDATATALAAIIHALAGVTASAAGNVITITVSAAGTAGNSTVLSTTAQFGLSVVAFSGGRNHLAIVIDGTTYTQGTDWNSVTDNDTTAAAIAAVIDLHADYNATSAAAVVTVEYDTGGAAGNAKAASSTGSGITISGATFAGGTDNSEIDIDVNNLVQGVDYNAATDNDTTATDIAAAIDAIVGYSASASGNVVTFHSNTPGTAGNAITCVYTGEGATISGATFAGGVAETFTEEFDYSGEGRVENVEATLDVTAISGTLPTLDVTPQYSHDKKNWYDQATAFPQQTAVNSVTREMNTVGKFMKFKIVLGGADPLASFIITGSTH